MKDEYEEEYSESKHGWLIWAGTLGLAALIVMAYRGRWGISSFDTATLDAFILVTAVFFLQETMTWFKHHTSKLVYDGNPGHTTFFWKDLKQLGRWGVAKKGGIMAAGVYWPGGEGTIVAPYDSFNIVGDCVVCTAKCEKTALEKLPSSVRKYTSDNKYPQPVEFGLFSTNQLKEPAIAKMESELKEQNAKIAMYEQYMKDITGVKEDLTEWLKRVSAKETTKDRIKEFFLGEGKGGEA